MTKPEGETLCFPFNSSVGGAATQLFTVRYTALACLEPDTGGSETTAKAEVQRCVPGTAGTANSCQKVTDAALDGSGGASGTQNRCVRLGWGDYRVVLTAPSSGAAVFWLEGEDR